MKKKEDTSYPSVSLDFLRSHSLFGGVGDEALKSIRELLSVKEFPAGTDILREGEPGGNLYLIWKGSVEALKKVPDAAEAAPVQLSVLKEGDSFGEMELIDIQPSGSTIRAREKTVTLILTNMDLYKIKKSDLPTFTMIIMNLAREISRWLRATDTAIVHSLFKKK